MTDDRQPELAALLEGAAGGDRRAFATLYARTSAKLYSTARRILVSQTAAEDAVQEAYVRIWGRAGDFDAGLGSPIAWMTTIARHAAIDMARRGPERVASASDLDPDLIDRIADPATGAKRLPAGSRLAGCLGKLEADRRAMVVLAYCYGWTREELARRFARPAATVKTVLRRSLIALKDCLGDRN